MINMLNLTGHFNFFSYSSMNLSPGSYVAPDSPQHYKSPASAISNGQQHCRATTDEYHI
jgi:hypothetical protein